MTDGGYLLDWTGKTNERSDEGKNIYVFDKSIHAWQNVDTRRWIVYNKLNKICEINYSALFHVINMQLWDCAFSKYAVKNSMLGNINSLQSYRFLLISEIDSERRTFPVVNAVAVDDKKLKYQLNSLSISRRPKRHPICHPPSAWFCVKCSIRISIFTAAVGCQTGTINKFPQVINVKAQSQRLVVFHTRV